MKRHWRTLSCLVGAGGLLVAALALSGSAAAAATAQDGGTFTCTGTIDSPGILAGPHTNVVISGACVVNAGPATVNGNLVIAPGGALTAIWALNDQTGTGNSDLTVRGNLTVQNGASLMLGCYSKLITVWGATHLITVPDFPCADDPNPGAPTLNTHDVVYGNLVADNPLGVVTHQLTVHGNVVQNGGGAGTGCAPVGIFNKYFGLPDYTTYTNVTVGGNLQLSGLSTCWFGIIRNTVQGNVTDTNNLSIPDANEVITNVIFGNLSCSGNSPAMELGDSNGQPNQVGGNATGECGFDVILPNPAPDVGVSVPPTFQPASVPLHHK